MAIFCCAILAATASIPPSDGPVLFMYGRGGGGHKASAKALSACVQQEHELVDVGYLIESFITGREIPRASGFDGDELYNFLMRRGWYVIAQVCGPVAKFITWLQRGKIERSLTAYWSRRRPRAVVSFVPFFNDAFRTSLLRACPDAPLFTVVTDFQSTPTHPWIPKWDEASAKRHVIVAGTPALQRQAEAIGYPPDHVLHTSGMVVHPVFTATTASATQPTATTSSATKPAVTSNTAPQIPAIGLVRLRLDVTPHDAALLVASATAVGHRLYVTLLGEWARLSFAQVQQRLLFVYQQVERARPGLDVRVLLPCAGCDAVAGERELDVLLGEAADEVTLRQLNEQRSALGLSSLSFVQLSAPPMQALPASTLGATVGLALQSGDEEHVPASIYEDVCVGGTFDYMHVGHKLLLSLAAYMSSQRLVVGVSDAPLLKRKVLRELMQPVGMRMALVEDFLRSVKPSITYDITALQDGFGPAIVDPRLSAILVSNETQEGGQMCNNKRGKTGLGLLDVVTMPLVDEGAAEAGTTIAEEEKVSSTGKRRELLVKLLLLKMCGTAATTAASAPSASDAIGSREFALICFGGFAPTRKTLQLVRDLRSSHPELRLVVLCGGNRGLQRRLNAVYNPGGEAEASMGCERDVLAEGALPAEGVAALMRSAAFVIGKPGPGLCSEACACGVPFVTHAADIMEQERAVLAHLEASGVGIVLPRLSCLPPDLADRLRDARAAISKQPLNTAAKEVADAITARIVWRLSV